MASIADIKAALTLAKTEAQKANLQTAALGAQLDKSIAILQALIGGIQQPAVLKAIANLQAAKKKLEESSASVNAAIADTDRYNTALGS